VKISPLKLLALTILCSLGNGCTSSDPDFCSLLSLGEVLEFDADVVSSQMGMRGKSAPTQYCIYSNSNNEEVFLLSIGNPTKNPPYKILKTYIPYMEGKNNFVIIKDIGNSAAALFSDDYETDKFRILLANSDDWSVTIRAKGISEKDSDKFIVLKELANKALSRF